MVCTILPKHRTFLGCGKYDSCLERPTSPLVTFFDRKLMKSNSDIENRDHDRLHDTLLLRELQLRSNEEWTYEMFLREFP